MNRDNRQRRSYGFDAQHTSSENPRQKRAVRRTASPQQKKQPTTRRHQPSGNTNWSLLWQVPAAIVMGIGRVLGFLWSKRPRFSKETKGAMRKKLLSISILLTALGFVAGTILIAWVSKDLPDPDRLTDREIAQSTKIYDRTGEELLYEIFADEKRTLVELEDISEHIVNGVIATEDTKFFEHRGIRPLSIARAVVKGILPGNRIEGTSTLTQQLVKNAILTNERSITRKVKEAILSIRLEQKYSKNQILKIYFNEIPYGSTNYGVESAAQAYFGKSASEVTLQEAATLAGLPKAPSTYLNNSDALKQRRDFVLRRMFDEGYITEEEKNAAQAEALTLSRNYGEIKAPHFVLYVREQLVEQFGEALVNSGGLSVRTSLDWEKQQIAERVVDEVGTPALEAAEADNTALVAMEPGTGHIIAMIGSKDFYDESIDGQFNVATLGKRQPGSSFKPIVYTAAFEKGYTADTILYDVETNFGKNSNRDYTPLNYDLSEHGPVTIRKSLQGSLNIPAVKALYLVGEKSGIDFAKRLGYSTFDNGDFGLTLVLGGGEVRPVEHVAAFGIFANEGRRMDTTSILEVRSATDEVLYEWKQERGEQVLEPEVTALISDVLSDDEARAYAFGTGGVLTLPGRSVAAKTGTTNGYIDGWTVGYTPSLVAGVWGGNTDNTPMKAGYGGSKVAGPIWKAFMTEALEGTPAEAFPEPPPNDATKPVLRGTESGGVTVQVNKVTGNLVSSSTPEHLIEERTYIQPNSILHYVLKDDPRGGAPENPAVDAQYEIWETAIQDWVVRKQEEDPEFKLEFGEAPTGVDDEYSIELIPNMDVIYPVPSSTITTNNLFTDIRVTAPRGVSVVRFYLDNRFIGLEQEHPFNLDYTASSLTPGAHTLSIEVEDDIGNRLREDIPFIYTPENSTSTVGS